VNEDGVLKVIVWNASTCSFKGSPCWSFRENTKMCYLFFVDIKLTPQLTMASCTRLQFERWKKVNLDATLVL